MPERGGFSVASVVLSYFLVAGGVALGLIGLTLLKPEQEAMLYVAILAGSALGGFAAGRASRGTTVTEPAIGGVLVVATLAGIFVGTDAGDFLWHVAKDEITRLVAIAAGAAILGALAGAIVSEKVLGAHSRAAAVWLVHVAIAVLGAAFVAMLVLLAATLRGQTGDGVQAGIYFGSMAAGALLAGLAAGASAPRRILLASFLGTIAGVMGFYLLMRTLPGVNDDQGDAAAGFAIIGVGCGLVTLLGAAIGWAAIGKRHA